MWRTGAGLVQGWWWCRPDGGGAELASRVPLAHVEIFESFQIKDQESGMAVKKAKKKGKTVSVMSHNTSGVLKVASLCMCLCGCVMDA